MSELPTGWALTDFGTLFDFKGGSQPPKSEFIDHPAPGYVRLLQIRDFESDAKAIYIKNLPKWPKCESSDIMIGRYGASVGKILGGKSGAYNVALVRLIFSRELLVSGWVRSFLRSDHFQIPLTRISRSAQNGFNKEDLAGVCVSLPPQEEQRRIVAKIDSLSTKSKRAREHLDHVPRLVEKFRRAVLSLAYRGKLLGGFPVGGGCRPIGEVIVSLDQGWSPKCESENATRPEDWAVIKTTSIQPMVFDDAENKLLPKHLSPRPEIAISVGDVLITRAGPRSRVAISCVVRKVRSSLMLCDKAYRLRAKPNIMDASFLAYMLNAPQSLETLEAMKTGISDSGLNLTQEKFLAMMVPAPDIETQRLVVSHIEHAFTWIDRLAKEATSARKLIDALDRSVLAKAFRGELVPQNPNDEPASVLLDRIRAERAAAPAQKRKRAAK